MFIIVYHNFCWTRSLYFLHYLNAVMQLVFDFFTNGFQTAELLDDEENSNTEKDDFSSLSAQEKDADSDQWLFLVSFCIF